MLCREWLLAEFPAHHIQPAELCVWLCHGICRLLYHTGPPPKHPVTDVPHPIMFSVVFRHVLALASFTRRCVIIQAVRQDFQLHRNPPSYRTASCELLILLLLLINCNHFYEVYNYLSWFVYLLLSNIGTHFPSIFIYKLRPQKKHQGRLYIRHFS